MPLDEMISSTGASSPCLLLVLKSNITGIGRCVMGDVRVRHRPPRGTLLAVWFDLLFSYRI